MSERPILNDAGPVSFLEKDHIPVRSLFTVLDLKYELPHHTQTHELKARSPAADVILRSGGSFTFCSSKRSLGYALGVKCCS